MRELRDRVVREVRKVVVGQDQTVEVLLAATVVGGHLLLEGVPGVAKTLLANAFARAIGVEFRRVQFTPDMLPSDLTGTMTLRAGELAFRPGPVFTNLLLADEINRTPPKTQAALLEAMQEAPGERRRRRPAAAASRSSSSRPRTRSSTKAPTRCRKRSSTGSSPSSTSGTPARPTRLPCCGSRTAASRPRRSPTCSR